MKDLFNIIAIIILITQALFSSCCVERHFEYESFVCVCDEEQCDSFPQIERPSKGAFKVMTSSRDQFRFDVTDGAINSTHSTNDVFARIFINSSEIRQTMVGFGGAFTDSTGINVLKLSPALQDVLLRQYFSTEGLEYNLGRIPIAGTDFSTYPYSYDDVAGDVELQFFNLTQEDYFYKLPLIKKAEELSNRDLHLFASPWSPPSWMKTNGMFNGSGSLLPEMREPWAQYYIRFLNAYAEEGITLWGLTVQNEPTAGKNDHRWNSCHYTPEEERDFVRDFLGPALANAGYRSLQLMVNDNPRIKFQERVETILNDDNCSSFVDGIAVHWYFDDITSPSSLINVHEQFPDKFILYTEACTGFIVSGGNHIHLGSWERAEHYATDVIETINHWSTGWTDWNMALSMIGGPNWASNYDESPIIVNELNNEFYKQPTFYIMGHFSKLVPEGSQNIGTSIELSGNSRVSGGRIMAVSFIDTEGNTIVNILNKNEENKVVSLEDSSGNVLLHELLAKSIQTIIYKETQNI